MSAVPARTRLATLRPDSIGTPSEKISVELGTRFLEHFSEQLYSSPQKAFEELISNGWDAGADCVDVRISPDLHLPSATMTVLDNGQSMDATGLKELWHIAYSPKTDAPFQFGRKIIGKFGIGKLSTYVLANKVTYICKAQDGIIRRVTMDYGIIDQFPGEGRGRLVRDIELDLFEVPEEQVNAALASLVDGNLTLDLIRNGVPRPRPSEAAGEFSYFGGPPVELVDKPEGTWTLVVLSDLKPAARELRVGVLRRMLEAALPIGSDMAISVNGELLSSSRIDKQQIECWTIGPDLGIDSIEIDESNGAVDEPDDSEADWPVTTPAKTLTRVTVTSLDQPYPHVEITGLGKVTGRVWLFSDRITGGISDARGASNGFHVNVLGRIVNQNDPSFGETNLSHAAWARFRMNVRADDLNAFLTTDREKFKDRHELRLFRAFLRRVFNKARTTYDEDSNAVMPKSGDVLVDSLGVLSLLPLRSAVSDALLTQSPIPGLFDDSGIDDKVETRRSWRENTAENLKSAVEQVKYEKIDDNSFVKFRISDNTIIVNSDHPFVSEHGRTKAEKELIRTVAMVNLLSDIYSLELGVDPAILVNIREYRDRLMRYKAMLRRQSGVHIARLLMTTQHVSGDSKQLETAVADALRYIGFDVRFLGKPANLKELLAHTRRQPTATRRSRIPILPYTSFHLMPNPQNTT